MQQCIDFLPVHRMEIIVLDNKPFQLPFKHIINSPTLCDNYHYACTMNYNVCIQWKCIQVTILFHPRAVLRYNVAVCLGMNITLKYMYLFYHSTVEVGSQVPASITSISTTTGK